MSEHQPPNNPDEQTRTIAIADACGSVFGEQHGSILYVTLPDTLVEEYELYTRGGLELFNTIQTIEDEHPDDIEIHEQTPDEVLAL